MTVLMRVCRSMGLRDVLVRERLHIQVSILLVIGDVVSKACDAGSFKSFALSAGSRIVCRCNQMFSV